MMVLKIKTMWSVGGGGVQLTSIPLWIVKNVFLIRVHNWLGFHKSFSKLCLIQNCIFWWQIGCRYPYYWDVFRLGVFVLFIFEFEWFANLLVILKALLNCEVIIFAQLSEWLKGLEASNLKLKKWKKKTDSV